MRTNLDAVASQTGMSGVFRLRGVDVHRVVRCVQVGGAVAAPAGRVERDAVAQLDELTRRVAACGEYDEAIAAGLQAIDDVLGFTHAILLVRDSVEERLSAVAGNGYASSPAGAEIAVGEGVIGTEAASGHVVCVPNLARSRVMQAAVRSGLEQQGAAPATEIPLPGLERAQSIAAVPLEAAGEVTGVLYLESEQAGRFGPHNERLLRVLGRHRAAALRAPSPVLVRDF
jgi:GAF domain-containing protein